MKRYLIAATAVAAAANPHLHKHRHLHDLAARAELTTTAIVATATVYEAAGTQIPKDAACAAVAEGKLTWANPEDAYVCQQAAETAAPAAPSTQPSPSPSADAGQFYGAPGVPSGPGPGNNGQGAVPSSPVGSAPPAAQTGWADSGATGLDADFPDGQIPCSTFPSAYGAINVDYLKLGGWIGLQNVGNGLATGYINNIETLVAGGTCGEGVMCSYACPPGYTKTQWPSTQGATGQSVGGLSCSGGMLRLTNPGLSKKLCMAGMGGVQAQNNANGVVAICRTDYPGTESETVPMELQPGQTLPVNNPDAASGYKWKGADTSAQYYLNPIGTSAASGCQWGSAGNPIGNWAPINFGVGYKDGKTWLSIFQNKPTQLAPYQGRVELQGDLSAKCYYENGQYCGATGCNADGCTVCFNPSSNL